MINNSKYLSQIALHQKCMLILEQLNKYILTLNDWEDKLSQWDCAKSLAPIRLTYHRSEIVSKIDSYTYYIKRTTAFYEKHSNRICSGTIVQIFGAIEKQLQNQLYDTCDSC